MIIECLGLFILLFNNQYCAILIIESGGCMFCSKCGNKVSESSSTCPMCGKPLNEKNGEDILNKQLGNKIVIAKVCAIISLGLAIMSIVLSLLGLLDYGWALLVWIYWMSIGVPVAIVSVIIGIISLLCRKNILAVIGIVVALLPLLFLFLINIS